jgi:serine/threonine-protein kinase
MSPEHANGQPIDARSDVFAAGIVLWELAAGRRMYRTGDGREGLLEQARKAEVPPLPASGLTEGDKLRAIVDKALARDRDARYPSAAAMLRDLEGYAATARLMTSPLQLGDWLERTFGEEILEKRRARERAAAALERGAPLFVQAIPATPRPPAANIAEPVIPPAPGLPATPLVPATTPARRAPLVAAIVIAVVALAAMGTWLAVHGMH